MTHNARTPEAENRARSSVPALRLLRLGHYDFWLECRSKVVSATIRKNEDLIIAGSGHATLYINHNGWLFRYRILHNGRRQIVDFILPGEMFGLQACLFERSLYSVVALTDSSLSAIPFSVIDEVFDHNRKLSRVLFWSTVCEAAILGEHLIDTGRRSAYERIGHFLLELFVRLQRTDRTDGLSFEMPLTQELIGDSLGLTTVHVNRTLRALREKKMIALNDRRVSLLNFDALCRVCDFQKSYLGEQAFCRG
jgi:CRP-like cAMP-binding protein